LSGIWRRYGKRLPGIDRQLQSPAFGQVGGIPSIPLHRLRSLCLYGVGGLVQWLRKPMAHEQKYSGANSPYDSPSWFELFFNVLVYPFLLFGTQTLEIMERSRR
jgi:hypothetical protein